jgi:translocation and assembly module TamB
MRALRIAPAGLPEWTSEAPAALALGNGVRLDGLRLRSGAQHAVLSTAVSRGGALAGTLTVTEVQLAPLCGLRGATCAGVLNGQLELGGTTMTPRLALGATAREVSAGPIAGTIIEADLRHERGRATGTITAAGLGGTVVVAGAVPAALPGLPSAPNQLDLTITARKLALARLPALAPRLVRTAEGRLRADLHVGGTWAAPRPAGTLTLRAPVFELVSSDARWEDVHIALRADGGSTLTIERLTAAAGKGTLTGSGHLDFGDGPVPTADVRLVFDRFLAVDRPILEASATGTLRVRGSLAAPIVRGRLYVSEGTVRPAFLPAANASTEPDPTIEVIGLPEDTPVPPPTSLGELTLGVTLTLGKSMHIRRRDADIQLGGTLRVERTPPEALRVSGTVKVERGWYTFSGRRFTLLPGAVRFDGGPVGDAELDIEATCRSGEYDVTVAVQGTVAKPALLLTSDPPLDETDVLAVLLVGRPGGELNDTERLNVQAEAASLAVGYVVPGLSGVLGEALPLEQVQVSPEQVRVGHRVGNDVVVSLSQQFVGWAGQTMAVEYAVTPRLSVELSTSSRGSGAIDFFWRRRY